MALQTIQVADKPTLDELKASIDNATYGLQALKTLLDNTAQGSSVDEVESLLKDSTYGLSAIKNSILEVSQNTIVTGMTHVKRFTSDAVFTVPTGITEIIMLGCGSGKGGYAGNFLLPTRYNVVPGEKINIVCGMDSTAGYKDTVITSPSLGTIKLLAGTVSRSIENTILGIPLGIQGGAGGAGAGGNYSGGDGGHGGLYGIGGGGAGGSGYNSGNSSYYAGSSGQYPGGAGGGGYSTGSHGSVAQPHPFGNNAGKNASNPYGGQGGNGIYYGAGGGFAGSGSTPGAAGNPSGGMVQIEW